MKKLFSLILGLITLSYAYAQKPIHYVVTFPQAIHHEAEVSMHMEEIKEKPLRFKMSRSSPGRYATHEFGKNIYHLKAFDENQKPLPIKVLQGDIFQIDNPGSKVKIQYTLFGNWVDGTYAAIDETHAHLNIPATFIYPEGYGRHPRTVSFPDIKERNWKVASQMTTQRDGNLYAPDFNYFMDSPIELAELKKYSWEVSDKSGQKQFMEILIHSKDKEEDIQNFGEMVKKMAAEQAAVWGSYPKFDFGRYSFIHDVYPDFAGDGMEHRNSTVIVQRTPQIKGNELNLLGTFSHEFFHAWNVERLRPQNLEPFKFEHANSSDALWFAEGFTQYYGNLTLKRAEQRTEDQILRTFTGFINSVLNTPGAKYFSPVEASQYAVFADAGVSIDQTNKANIFTSYYSYGAAIALGLDLELRAYFNSSLDKYMQTLWSELGIEEKYYTLKDLENCLAKVTSTNYAANFFKQNIYGTQKSNYQELLKKAGYELVKSKPNQAYSGLERSRLENGKITIGQTLKDSPAYLAGLNAGAYLTALNDVKISSPAQITEITNKLKPGDKLKVNYTYFGLEKTTSLTLIENNEVEIITFERLGKEVSAETKKFRESWLSSQL